MTLAPEKAIVGCCIPLSFSMNEQNSKKQILKSSSIIGGASIISIVVGLVKVKGLAMIMGPGGVGLQSLLGLAGTLFGLGLGTTGVREIARFHDQQEKVDEVRKALFMANLMLGLLAAGLIISFRETLSEQLFGSSDHQLAVCLVGVGVLFTLIGASQGAVLQGFRKIVELAKIKIITALVSTVIGLGAVYYLGSNGIAVFLLVLPVTGCLCGLFYTRKLPGLGAINTSWSKLRPLWKSMVALGSVYMLSGFMGEGTKLLVREFIIEDMDLHAVGYFQAAWSISMTYIGLVLGAMAADYYPRLTQSMDNRKQANVLVNQQTEIAVVFAAPIILGMITFAPWVITVLYSGEFAPSIEILRWQVAGDILKIVAWPISFIVLASGKGKLYFLLEMSWNISYILLVYFGLQVFGLEATGYAFVLSYLVYLCCSFWSAKRLIGFYWISANKKFTLWLLAAAAIILLISYYHSVATMLVGGLFTVFSTLVSLRALNDIGVGSKRINQLLLLGKKLKLVN